ncbi:hypothetical protein D3C80_1260740 [compost metagenome]
MFIEIRVTTDQWNDEGTTQTATDLFQHVIGLAQGHIDVIDGKDEGITAEQCNRLFDKAIKIILNSYSRAIMHQLIEAT